MNHSFADLYRALDETTSTKAKTEALVTFFDAAQAEDKLWAVAILSGKRPKRLISSTELKTWAMEQTGLAPWHFEECYALVGDLAETIHLLLPPAKHPENITLSAQITMLTALRSLPSEEKRAAVVQLWDQLQDLNRFTFLKLITGGMRVGVSRKLMARALSEHLNQDPNEVAQRLMGNWTAETTTWDALFLSAFQLADSQPYPFQLANSFDADFEAAGALGTWQIEWKWDGIRAQVIQRQNTVHIWSRGEDLITDRFPDLCDHAQDLPSGTVMDGEILAWDYQNNHPMPFAALQKRLNRKTVSKPLMKEVPIKFLAYDLLEAEGVDLRHQSLAERRGALESLFAKIRTKALSAAPLLTEPNWNSVANQRALARAHHAEGLMIKAKASPYIAGRLKAGAWYKWKLDPLTIDGVLLYAQSGHGRRAGLFTDYTFGVWEADRLVPFTKAYSGLTDKEFKEVTAWVKKNTVEKFGPVRSVPAELVFEVAFEGIAASSRHKSGVALRFPRILRWRKDKSASEANSLTELKDLLDTYG